MKTRTSHFDQIAAEATSEIGLQVVRGGLTPTSYGVALSIILSAIEKAHQEGYKQGALDQELQYPPGAAHASEPHIIEEGSRRHVISYDNHGSHCSEPNCEINRPAHASKAVGVGRDFAVEQRDAAHASEPNAKTN